MWYVPCSFECFGLDTNTSQAPEDKAGATLASIPEHVEQMVLQLPLRDILLAQRISKAWNGVIANFPRLQKAIFFRPVEDV